MKNYLKIFIEFLFKLANNNILCKFITFKKILRLKTLFLCVFIIVFYVSLNNYLIIFIYFDNSSQRPVLKKQQQLQAADLPVNATTKSIFQKPIYIDSQDIILDSLKNDKSLKVFNEDYFDDVKHVNNNPPIQRPCIHPKLNPFDKEILKFVVPEKLLICNPKKNWISVANGSIILSKEAATKHGSIVCAYIPLYRDDDFKVREGNRIFPVVDRMPLITDFFKIDCRSKDGAIYSNIHSGIAYDSTLRMRPIWNPLNKYALGYNVLMLGFDSVSRMSFIRMLPKTYEYIIKELGIVVLKGYNIVGDGTPQALLPILTGKKETELPEARRGFVNAGYVDSFPWVWNDYKKNGYVTQWAEDMQSIGTFQLRMLGFKNQPVDHYMRLFYLEAERYYARFRRLCLGSITRHENLFNWIKEFFTMYKTQPKFSFIFHSETSHNYNNPLSLIDDDLKKLLIYLKSNGYFDNTIFFLMSDHGVRVSDLRQYSQGKLEEVCTRLTVLLLKLYRLIL